MGLLIESLLEFVFLRYRNSGGIPTAADSLVTFGRVCVEGYFMIETSLGIMTFFEWGLLRLHLLKQAPALPAIPF
jgi:hypothetical protein